MAIDLAGLHGEHLAFWSRGNRPTQLAFGINMADALLNLKALYLLSDRVVAAASFFFESPLTRTVVSRLKDLIAEREILFFIDEELENFTEHGIRKVEKSPPGLVAYRDLDIIRELGSSLDHLGEVLHRPSVDLSGRIVELWTDDVTSLNPGSLGHIVARLAAGGYPEERGAAFLGAIPARRRGDFVWEHVDPLLQEEGWPRAARHAVRRRLAQLYGQATGEALAADLDSPRLSAHRTALTRNSVYDTELFLACLQSLGLKKELLRCTASDLIEIKNSAEWRIFRAFYAQLIEEAVKSAQEIREFVPIMVMAESLIQERWHSEVQIFTRGDFLRTWTKMLRLVGGREVAARYRSIAHRLYAIFEAFGAGAFQLLKESLYQRQRNDERTLYLARDHSHFSDNRNSHLWENSMSTELRSFIVHGHDPAIRLELKDFLQNTLGWPEPIILEQQPNRMRTIIEKFEECAQEVDIVFVLLTPDDNGPVGAHQRRVRQNVLYELGYFVGRFGRTSGRVVLLSKGEWEIPSDLHGVLYIDISGGIEAAGEKIRREVSILQRLTPGAKMRSS